MSRLLYFAIFMMVSITSFSQIKFSEAEVMFHNQYIWRGQKLGTGASIEPSVTFSSGNFSINAWAVFTFNNSYKEIDLIPSYQFKYFCLTLLDYYIPVQDSIVPNQYLNFQKGKNRHWLELNIDNYSIDEQRFKWMVGTFFSGDKNEDTNKAYYSTYVEFKYPFTVLSVDAEPFIGATPFKGMYANKFAIIHTGITFSKELDLKLPFKIPVNLSFATNPYAKKSFVTFGAGIAF